MLLENKVPVARAFSREGDTLFLTDHTKVKLEKIADEIRSGGGSTETEVVDALDEQGVDQFVDDVVRQAGQIDISFNHIASDQAHTITATEVNISCGAIVD